MRKTLTICLGVCLMVTVADADPARVRLATTTSTDNSGLLAELAPPFEKMFGVKLDVIAVGTGKALRLGENGDVDVVLVHAKEAELKFIEEGYGVNRREVMHNDFVIIGPKSDPAGIRGMTDAAEALRKIVKTKSELLIQRSLGAQQVLFDLVAMGRVQLDWQHVVVHLDDKRREMLLAASQKNAYVLVGRIPFLNGKIRNRDLVIMVQGDPRLRRPYLVVVANPRRQAPALAAATRQLAAYLHKPETQAWIAEYGRGRLDSQPLFFPVKIPGKNGPGS